MTMLGGFIWFYGMSDLTLHCMGYDEVHATRLPPNMLQLSTAAATSVS